MTENEDQVSHVFAKNQELRKSIKSKETVWYREKALLMQEMDHLKERMSQMEKREGKLRTNQKILHGFIGHMDIIGTHKNISHSDTSLAKMMKRAIKDCSNIVPNIEDDCKTLVGRPSRASRKEKREARTLSRVICSSVGGQSEHDQISKYKYDNPNDKDSNDIDGFYRNTNDGNVVYRQSNDEDRFYSQTLNLRKRSHDRNNNIKVDYYSPFGDFVQKAYDIENPRNSDATVKTSYFNHQQKSPLGGSMSPFTYQQTFSNNENLYNFMHDKPIPVDNTYSDISNCKLDKDVYYQTKDSILPGSYGKRSGTLAEDHHYSDINLGGYDKIFAERHQPNAITNVYIGHGHIRNRHKRERSLFIDNFMASTNNNDTNYSQRFTNEQNGLMDNSNGIPQFSIIDDQPTNSTIPARKLTCDESFQFGYGPDKDQEATSSNNNNTNVRPSKFSIEANLEPNNLGNPINQTTYTLPIGDKSIHDYHFASFEENRRIDKGYNVTEDIDNFNFHTLDSGSNEKTLRLNSEHSYPTKTDILYPTKTDMSTINYNEVNVNIYTKGQKGKIGQEDISQTINIENNNEAMNFDGLQPLRISTEESLHMKSGEKKRLSYTADYNYRENIHHHRKQSSINNNDNIINQINTFDGDLITASNNLSNYKNKRKNEQKQVDYDNFQNENYNPFNNSPFDDNDNADYNNNNNNILFHQNHEEEGVNRKYSDMFKEEGVDRKYSDMSINQQYQQIKNQQVQSFCNRLTSNDFNQVSEIENITNQSISPSLNRQIMLNFQQNNINKANNSAIQQSKNLTPNDRILTGNNVIEVETQTEHINTNRLGQDGEVDTGNYRKNTFTDRNYTKPRHKDSNNSNEKFLGQYNINTDVRISKNFKPFSSRGDKDDNKNGQKVATISHNNATNNNPNHNNTSYTIAESTVSTRQKLEFIGMLKMKNSQTHNKDPSPNPKLNPNFFNKKDETAEIGDTYRTMNSFKKYQQVNSTNKPNQNMIKFLNFQQKRNMSMDNCNYYSKTMAIFQNSNQQKNDKNLDKQNVPNRNKTSILQQYKQQYQQQISNYQNKLQNDNTKSAQNLMKSMSNNSIKTNTQSLKALNSYASGIESDTIKICNKSEINYVENNHENQTLRSTLTAKRDYSTNNNNLMKNLTSQTQNTANVNNGNSAREKIYRKPIPSSFIFRKESAPVKHKSFCSISQIGNQKHSSTINDCLNSTSKTNAAGRKISFKKGIFGLNQLKSNNSSAKKKDKPKDNHHHQQSPDDDDKKKSDRNENVNVHNSIKKYKKQQEFTQQQSKDKKSLFNFSQLKKIDKGKNQPQQKSGDNKDKFLTKEVNNEIRAMVNFKDMGIANKYSFMKSKDCELKNILEDKVNVGGLINPLKVEKNYQEQILAEKKIDCVNRVGLANDDKGLIALNKITGGVHQKNKSVKSLKDLWKIRSNLKKTINIIDSKINSFL